MCADGVTWNNYGAFDSVGCLHRRKIERHRSSNVTPPDRLIDGLYSWSKGLFRVMVLGLGLGFGLWLGVRGRVSVTDRARVSKRLGLSQV